MNKPSNLVLLIEDEPKIRRFLRAGFEIHGFSVLEAESAADGLKAATFSAPDLIILDLALPDLHGTEVLERLRSWSNVPVIILSVVSSEEEKVRLLQAGAAGAQRSGPTAIFQDRNRESRCCNRSPVDQSRQPNRVTQQEPNQADPKRVSPAPYSGDACRPRGDT
jgi:CheY-like chemotaxis protein